MSENIANYIAELNTVLGRIVRNEFDVKIEGNFVGQFVDLKVSVNKIVDHLNDVFGRLAMDLRLLSGSIMRDSANLAESSNNMVDTSHNQTNAIHDLGVDIRMISAQITSMTENASKVNALSQKSRENANVGNERMKALLEAMDKIGGSSNKILKVIKVIEDIAFQTDLLALNAAIEAAKAGEKGRGFGVVADHVRNLANRSTNSAAESSKLIHESLSEIRAGILIAHETGTALNVIVGNVVEVYGRIESISASTVLQENAIKTINEAMDILGLSAADSAATSEEVARIASELTGRSQDMNSMINELE